MKERLVEQNNLQQYVYNGGVQLVYTQELHTFEHAAPVLLLKTNCCSLEHPRFCQ